MDAKNYRWMLLWGLSILFLVPAIVWSLLNSFSIILEYWKRIDIVIPLVAITVVLLTVIILSLVLKYGFDVQYGSGVPGKLLSIIREYDSSNDAISIIKYVVNVFSMLVIFLLALSISVLAMDYDSDEKEIRQRTTHIYASLYSSAALIVTMIFEVYCFYSWSSALSTEEMMTHVGDSIIIVSALSLSPMLAIIYIPLFIKRNRLISRHLDEKGIISKKDADNWYAENNLEKRIGDKFSDMAVFASPIITSVLISVINEM